MLRHHVSTSRELLISGHCEEKIHMLEMVIVMAQSAKLV
jgi:hypothetical protein